MKRYTVKLLQADVPPQQQFCGFDRCDDLPTGVYTHNGRVRAFCDEHGRLAMSVSWERISEP